MQKQLKDKILSLNSNDKTIWNETVMQAFYYQYHNNKLYNEFCNYLNRNPKNISSRFEIPFLPVSVFKSHKVITGNIDTEVVFRSSGTTGMERSSHYVADIELYKAVFRKGFAKFYGNIRDYALFALLPSYLEQGNSSLVFMVNKLIEDSHNPYSGFYLNDYELLTKTINEAKSSGYKIFLWGVTYALLDFAETAYSVSDDIIVMETGGMKGRRREMVRSEVHERLSRFFGVENIHSEYGMTELMSQAYSQGKGIFYASDTMEVIIRDTNDPFSVLENGRSGGINLIDLGNIHSCCFISTQDLGKKLPDEGFEVLGRFDNSDIRGCNLMVE